MDSPTCPLFRHDQLNQACKSGSSDAGADASRAQAAQSPPINTVLVKNKALGRAAAAGGCPSQPWHGLTPNGDGSSRGAGTRCKPSHETENPLTAHAPSLLRRGGSSRGSPRCCQRGVTSLFPNKQLPGQKHGCFSPDPPSPLPSASPSRGRDQGPSQSHSGQGRQPGAVWGEPGSCSLG